MNSGHLAARRERLRRGVSGSSTIASNSTAGILSEQLCLDRLAPFGSRRDPPASPPAEALRPSASSGACSVATASPSTPSATRIATLRVRMPPSPGSAVSDNAGDVATSAFAGSESTFGSGLGSSMPRP